MMSEKVMQWHIGNEEPPPPPINTKHTVQTSIHEKRRVRLFKCSWGVLVGVCVVPTLHQSTGTTDTTQWHIMHFWCHSTSSPPLFAMMDSEQVYIHELARRSVARAALHIGIDDISEEALDVLADVLMNHVERIGKCMSKLVESSGRTSAHTNILDAIEAIRMTTSPVVNQLHHKQQPDTDNPYQISTTVTWEQLASFCFGPTWNQTGRVAAAGGGKGVASETSGWVAPYIEEVLHFPTASDRCANPHPLGPHAGLSLHNHVVKEQVGLDLIPDGVFLQKEWGVLGEKTISVTKDNADASDGPAPKKAKTDKTVNESNTPKKSKPSYIPRFFPPYPESYQHATRTIVETEDTIANNADDATAIRSSLVDLRGSIYWGAIDTISVSPSVLPGRKSAKTEEMPTAIINPLARASVNRVSKILEGSLDQMN